MIYTEKDVNFHKINSTDFERLCYQLLLRYGFSQLIWRQGGPDSGRDIEGVLPVTNELFSHHTKWHFECKHHASGVGPDKLHAKIAWADAEKPDYLVILLTSYLSNSARIWLEQVRVIKVYKIVVIEGQDMKNRVSKFPDLVEQFFADDRYEHLYHDIKRHFQQYKVKPGIDVIREIAREIPMEKFSLNDIGFLLTQFYSDFWGYENSKNDNLHFAEHTLMPLYERLKQLNADNSMPLIKDYLDDYDFIQGHGFIEDIENQEKGSEEYSFSNYQYYALHLNANSGFVNWIFAHYAFFKTPFGDAFELFTLDDSDFTTFFRHFSHVDETTFDLLAFQGAEHLKDEFKKLALVLKKFEPDQNAETFIIKPEPDKNREAKLKLKKSK